MYVQNRIETEGSPDEFHSVHASIEQNMDPPPLGPSPAQTQWCVCLPLEPQRAEGRDVYPVTSVTGARNPGTTIAIAAAARIIVVGLAARNWAASGGAGELRLGPDARRCAHVLAVRTEELAVHGLACTLSNTPHRNAARWVNAYYGGKGRDGKFGFDDILGAMHHDGCGERREGDEG